MAFSPDLGTNAFVVAAGGQMPADLSGTNAIFNRNLREVIVANGGNPFIGLAPGAADSGFNLAFKLPKAGAAAFLNSLLDTDGIAVASNLGSAGGAQLAVAFLESMTVQCQGLNDIQGTAVFKATIEPTLGPSGTVADLGEVFTGADVVSFTGLAGVARTKFSQFSFEVQRVLSRYDGFSPTGLPLLLRVAYSRAMLTARYLKGDDSEGAYALGPCPQKGDCSVHISDACGGLTPSTLNFAVTASVYRELPQTTGATIAWIEETATAMASRGAFTIG